MTSRIDASFQAIEEIGALDPAWIALNKKEADRKEWFPKALDALEKFSQYRISSHVNNILWYLGEYDKTLEYRMIVPGQGERQVPRRILPRIFSHLFDITEQRVSRLSALKPSFDVVPTNQEQKDWQQSRLYKTALDALSRRVHMDFLIQEAERWNCVCGEVLISIEWNPDIGDRKGYGSTERIGDVDVRLKEPWTWLPEPKRRKEDVYWGIDIKEIIHVEEARVKYEDKKIEPDGKKYVYKFNEEIQEKREDEVIVYRIIERPSLYVKTGRITTIINGKEVNRVEEKYPYSHNEFPFEWHTDIDIPGRLFPISFYQHLQPIQHVYNRLTSIMVRNALLVGHPHILMPKGAAKIEAFGNGPTAIEYSGPIEPKIATFGSIPNEFFEFRKEVLQEMNQISGIQGVSRGAPPSGVRAASMLRFYEEQEQQRASTQIGKHNELIRRIFLKSASVMADYYTTTGKERLIRVLGKENQYQVQAFINSKPSSEYDIIIQNSSGFSESKAGRLEELKTIQEMAPNLLSPEQTADVLELSNTKKAYDIMTAALRHAESENERFIDGAPVPLPQKYEDLIVHWKTHMILFNSTTWAEHVTPEAKEKAYDHMLVTERFMEEKAQNPAFAQSLAMLPGYPAFWVVTPAPPKPPAPAPAPAMPDMGLPPEGSPSMMPPIQPPEPQGVGSLGPPPVNGTVQ